MVILYCCTTRIPAEDPEEYHDNISGFAEVIGEYR